MLSLAVIDLHFYGPFHPCQAAFPGLCLTRLSGGFLKKRVHACARLRGPTCVCVCVCVCVCEGNGPSLAGVPLLFVAPTELKGAMASMMVAPNMSMTKKSADRPRKEGPWRQENQAQPLSPSALRRAEHAARTHARGVFVDNSRPYTLLAHVARMRQRQRHHVPRLSCGGVRPRSPPLGVDSIGRESTCGRQSRARASRRRRSW